MPVESDFLQILTVLHRHEVDFVIVGGIAAILQGSPVMTEDLDLVYSTEPDNVSRLAHAVREIEARYRDPAGRIIEPDEAKLASLRINLLDTRLGKLDLLWTIGNGAAFIDLLPRCETFEVAGLRLSVIPLEVLIEAKEIADRPKDRQALPFLRQLLALQQGNEEGRSSQ